MDIVYVLFDYSRSLDTNSIKVTAKRAYDLVMSCPVGTTLEFLPIDNNPFTQPALFYTAEQKPSYQKEVKKWEMEKIDKASQIGSLIMAMHNSSDINSCIVHGFSTVYNYARNLSGNYNIRLIVLSDMLECCDNLPCAQSIRGFQKLLEEMDEYNLSATPLSQAVPFENITIVINSSNLPKIKEIYNSPNREFYQFWEAVATGMGYNKAFTMSPTLPKLGN
ncbi:MAG: hypothetical protein J5I98_25450 [Phaeodactylibacter sp.]|nr:hypothetical protein [Phaeodactylibacter sp.]